MSLSEALTVEKVLLLTQMPRFGVFYKYRNLFRNITYILKYIDYFSHIIIIQYRATILIATSLSIIFQCKYHLWCPLMSSKMYFTKFLSVFRPQTNNVDKIWVRNSLSSLQHGFNRISENSSSSFVYTMLKLLFHLLCYIKYSNKM